MKTLKALGILAILLVLFIAGYYVYMGGLRTVQVAKQDFPATEVVFGTHRGHYRTLNLSWDKFRKGLDKAGLKTCDAYGIYLDRPDTPKDQLRSILACSLTDVAPDLKARLKESFPTFTIPASEVYTASFPFKNEASYFLAPMKVYPKFQNLIATDAIRPSVSIEGYGAEETPKEIRFYMPAKLERSEFQPLMDAF